MNLQILGKKITDQLTSSEKYLLLNLLENNPRDLLNAIQPTLLHPNERFVSDVCVFFSGISYTHGHESAQTETVLEEYAEEFSEFAQALTLFSPTNIKTILLQLSGDENFDSGTLLTRKLLSELKTLLNKTDFDFLLSEKEISFLYK